MRFNTILPTLYFDTFLSKNKKLKKEDYEDDQ